MSEFRLTGVQYVSEWNGDDANAGTDPDLPKKTIQSTPTSLTDDIIVGTGYYTGTWTGARKLTGDGKVIIDGLGLAIPTAQYSTSGTLHFMQNLHFKNMSLFRINSSSFFHDNLILENVDAYGDLTLIACRFRRSIFLNDLSSNNTSTNVGLNAFENCLLLGGVTGAGTPRIVFSYIPKGKKTILKGTLTSAQNNFTDNLHNGIIEFGGDDYELKRLFDGSTRPDADPSIPDLLTIFPNVYTNRNFAGTANIIDALNKVVGSNSELLFRSNGFGFIGGVRAGRVIPVSTTEPNVTVTSERINTSDPQNWVIQTSEDDGWIDMKFRVSSQIVQCPVINFIAQLAFDGSIAGGAAGNNNVPDATPESYTPLSQPNLKPNRLVYLFRSSKSVNMPTTDAGWDNDGDTIGTPVIAGNFYAMEWSNGNRRAPSIRINGGVAYGNSNFEESGGAENFINVRWVNIRIRLTDLRSYV